MKCKDVFQSFDNNKASGQEKSGDGQRQRAKDDQSPLTTKLMKGGGILSLFQAGNRDLRSKIIVLMVALLFLAAIGAPAQADFKKTKVAVLDFQLQGEGYETDDMGMIVAEWFITALVKAGRFDVVERALLNKILNEQKMSLSGIVDENSATQLGKILGVKIIISGSVMKLREVLEINARIIDVETATIIAAESVKSSASTDLQSLIVQMSDKIIKNFPLEGYIVARDNNNISIDLGRMAGVRPDMEFIVFKEGRVIKHPKTGEVLDIEKIQTGLLKITRVNSKIAYAEIIEENETAKISVGHLVKSISGQLPGEYQENVSAPTPTIPSRNTPAAHDLSANTTIYIAKLRSPNLRDKAWAAKKVVKTQLRDPAVFAVIEEVLLEIYKDRPANRRAYKQHADVVAWLCKALGASKMVEYKKTLRMIAEDKDVPRKIKKYANSAYKGL